MEREWTKYTNRLVVRFEFNWGKWLSFHHVSFDFLSFEPYNYLKTLSAFHWQLVSENFFSHLKLAVWAQKLAAILTRPKQSCDVTGCITFMPRWKFRVIMGRDKWSKQKNVILRTSHSCKVVNKISLTHKEKRLDTVDFSISLDISRIFYDGMQANECVKDF